MAKGNLFMGTGHGKVGDVVLYRTNGKQISRAYISKVSNPRSEAQMRTRIISSTLAKLYSKLRVVSDHAFEGKSTPAANMQEFMKVNNRYVREQLVLFGDAMGNFNARTQFDALANRIYVSKGTLPSLDNIVGVGILAEQGGGAFELAYNLRDDRMQLTPTSTYQEVVDALGVQAGDQLSFVVALGNREGHIIENVSFYRVILAPASGNMSLPFITSEGAVNDPNPRNISNGVTFTMDSDSSSIYVNTPDVLANMTGGAVVVSRYEAGMWRRSNSLMIVADNTTVQSMAEAIASWYTTIESSKWLNQSVPVAEDVDNWRANIASLNVGGQSYPFDRALSWTITSATAVPVVITAVSADLAANITAKRGNTALTPTTSGAAVTFSMNESGTYRFYYRDHLILSVNFTMGE